MQEKDGGIGGCFKWCKTIRIFSPLVVFLVCVFDNYGWVWPVTDPYTLSSVQVTARTGVNPSTR